MKDMSELRNPFAPRAAKEKATCARPPVWAKGMCMASEKALRDTDKEKKPKQMEYDIGEDEQVLIIRYNKKKTIAKAEDVTVQRPKGTEKEDEIALCMAAANLLCGDFSHGLLKPEAVFTKLMEVMTKELVSLSTMAMLVKALRNLNEDNEEEDGGKYAWNDWNI